MESVGSVMQGTDSAASSLLLFATINKQLQLVNLSSALELGLAESVMI